MKKTILLFLFAASLSTAALGQQYRMSNEIQSSFIDITGLFGVKEPANVTQFSYIKNGFGLDVYHSFSLKKFGNTIQTLVIPSYRLRLDSAGRWFLKPKADLFYNQPSGGAFIRPGVHLIYQLHKQHSFQVAIWLFVDLRDTEGYPRRLDGITYYLSYAHNAQVRYWQFSQESRLLYVDIKGGLKVAGAFQNVQFLYKPVLTYVGANVAYPFYRSDQQRNLSWNLTVGKIF